MPLARAIILGRCLNERLAVNGSHQASRSLGARESLAALEIWAVMAFPRKWLAGSLEHRTQKWNPLLGSNSMLQLFAGASLNADPAGRASENRIHFSARCASS